MAQKKNSFIHLESEQESPKKLKIKACFSIEDYRKRHLPKEFFSEE